MRSMVTNIKGELTYYDFSRYSTKDRRQTNWVSVNKSLTNTTYVTYRILYFVFVIRRLYSKIFNSNKFVK